MARGISRWGVPLTVCAAAILLSQQVAKVAHRRKVAPISD